MGSGELSERDVIRGAQAGEERMYRELVTRYVRPALAVAWEFTDSLDDAEDLVQEAFRRVVDALHRFDADCPFAPWFFTCATSPVTPPASAPSDFTNSRWLAGFAACSRS